MLRLVVGLVILVVVLVIAARLLMPDEIKKMEETARTFSADPDADFGVIDGMHFARSGAPDAPVTLLFVHGSPGGWDAFARLLLDPELKARFHMIAPDRPGYGKTQPGVHVGSMKEQARRLANLVKNRPGKIIWFGHSFGPPLVTRAALDFPDRVDGMILVAGAMDPALEEPKWFHQLGGTRLGRRVLSPMWDVTNQEVLDFEQGLVEMEPELERLTVPTIVIHGQKDGLARYGHVDYMRRRLTNTRPEIVTLEDGNHFILWNRFEVMKEAILRLADRLEGE